MPRLSDSRLVRSARRNRLFSQERSSDNTGCAALAPAVRCRAPPTTDMEEPPTLAGRRLAEPEPGCPDLLLIKGPPSGKFAVRYAPAHLKGLELPRTNTLHSGATMTNSERIGPRAILEFGTGRLRRDWSWQPDQAKSLINSERDSMSAYWGLGPVNPRACGRILRRSTFRLRRPPTAAWGCQPSLSRRSSPSSRPSA